MTDVITEHLRDTATTSWQGPRPRLHLTPSSSIAVGAGVMLTAVSCCPYTIQQFVSGEPVPGEVSSVLVNARALFRQSG